MPATIPKMTVGDTMMLAPKHLAYDSVFNYARNVTPTEDSETKTLMGAVGGDSPVDSVIHPILYRAILESEQNQWKELHAQADEYKDMSDEDFLAATPDFVVVDGFGRVEAHIAQFGDEVEMEVKEVDLSGVDEDQWIVQSLILAGLLNSSQRGMHYLDELNLFTTLKKTGLSQTQIGKMFGKSKPYVTATFKLAKLDEKKRRKCIEKGVPRYKAVEWAAKQVEPGTGTGTGANGSGSGSGDTEPTGKPLSVKDRSFYIRGCELASESSNKTEQKILAIIKFAFRFTNGDFGSKTMKEAAEAEKVFAEDQITFDFEHDTKSILEDERQKAAAVKKAEKETAAKKKAEEKEAAAAKKAEEKKAEKEQAKALKEAEALEAKAAKAREAAEAKTKAAQLAKKKAGGSKKKATKKAGGK